MEESSDLYEWELVHNSSDSDDNAPFEQIIRADYFAIDDDRFGDKSEKFRPGGDKGGSFLECDPDLEVGFEGIEPGLQISEQVQLHRKSSEELRSGSGEIVDSSNMEVGFEGIGEFERGSEKRESFLVGGSELEVGFEGIEAGDRVSDGAEDQTELGFGGVDGTEGSSLQCVPIGKVDSFLADDSQAELEVEEIQLSHENYEEFRSGSRKGDSCIVDCLRMEAGFEGIEEFERGSEKGDSFLLNVLEMEVGFEGSEAGDRVSDVAKDQIELGSIGVVDGSYGSNSESIRTGGGNYFPANESQLELGVEDSDVFRSDSGKGVSFIIDDSGMGAGAGSQGFEEKFGSGSEKGGSFLANRSEVELGTEGIERDQTELGFGGVEGSEGSNSEIPVGEGEKKGIVWWKLPMEILKFYVFRMRPIWSIPIAAAVIGIVMMGRRLYRMKHKSRRLPLKVSFEDKKAAAKVLLRAARLNEAVVRRVPVVRSPLLPASGVTPWPLLGLL